MAHATANYSQPEPRWWVVDPTVEPFRFGPYHGPTQANLALTTGSYKPTGTKVAPKPAPQAPTPDPGLSGGGFQPQPIYPLPGPFEELFPVPPPAGIAAPGGPHSGFETTPGVNPVRPPFSYIPILESMVGSLPARSSGDTVALNLGDGDDMGETLDSIFFDEITGRRRPHVFTKQNVRAAKLLSAFGEDGLELIGARVSPRRRFVAGYLVQNAPHIMSIPDIQNLVPSQRRFRRRFTRRPFNSVRQVGGGRSPATEAAFQRGLASGQRRALPAPR